MDSSRFTGSCESKTVPCIPHTQHLPELTSDVTITCSSQWRNLWLLLKPTLGEDFLCSPQMSFYCFRFPPRIHLAISAHQALLDHDGVSDLPCFWHLGSWGVPGRYSAGQPSTWVCAMFSWSQSWSYGFWEEDHSKRPSHPTISGVPAVHMTYHLDHLWGSGGICQVLRCNSFFLLPYGSLSKDLRMHSPHFKGQELCPTSLRAEHLINYLGFFCSGEFSACLHLSLCSVDLWYLFCTLKYNPIH